MASHRNIALGAFLRDRRERLDPAVLNLPTLRRRRTRGLRREEVAERAGIGVDWYVRLEQGRSVSPSPATVEALADALCLSSLERDHLRAIALNPMARPFQTETVSPGLQAFVTALAEPAYVTGQRWDVLFWNRAARDLLFDFAAVPENERNILSFMFLDPSAQRLFADDWQPTAQRMVAMFRKTYDLWASDAAFRELAKNLIDNSPAFSAWWHRHDIAARDTHIKTIHRAGAARAYLYASFQVADDPALSLAVYTPV